MKWRAVVDPRRRLRCADLIETVKKLQEQLEESADNEYNQPGQHYRGADGRVARDEHEQPRDDADGADRLSDTSRAHRLSPHEIGESLA